MAARSRTSNSSLRRPDRWNEPFDASQSAADVERLLTLEPFRSMDPSRFPRLTPLEGLLRNDCRIVRCSDREIVIREGDYGHSAFLILQGEVEVALERLPPAALGRATNSQLSWWQSFLSAWRTSPFPEVRDDRGDLSIRRDEERGARVFLQDFPRLVGPDGRLTLTAGEMFGELAALSRTPRSATVVAKGDCELLEIRWQGLRDLMRYAPALRAHIDRLYRQNGLRVHLRETPWLADLDEAALHAVAEATIFESYGEFEWSRRLRDQRDLDPRDRIEREPLIAAEGDHPDGLILIRSGFARVSVRHDAGHRTLEYLGKGGVFGLEEAWKNHQRRDQLPWLRSLRALGYVDVLRIPTPIVELHLLPRLHGQLLLKFGGTASSPSSTPVSQSLASEQEERDTDRIEFLVEERLLNATRALVIDLDRCTRCDDCVRACATTHGGNPRFTREGPIHDRILFAHACMHCQDPICMIGCPTGAIGRDAHSGVVTINDSTCIGCGTCAASCPYDNIRMVEIRDRAGNVILDERNESPVLKATKCDFCHSSPAAPACQNACPHDALVRIDLTTPAALDAWLSNRRAA